MKKIIYFFGGLTVFIVLISPLFIKIKIECKSQLDECPSETNVKLQMLNAKSLLTAKRLASKILKNDYLISNFTMQLKLPNTLLINVIVKKPIFSIFDKSQNKYFLIDINGIVLASSDSSNLPTLIKDSVGEKEGQKITEADLFALKLIQGINQMYQINIGVTQNDTLVVDMPGRIRVILPLDATDVAVLLGSLRLIYTKVTTDNPVIYSQIDMRYKNPVIR